MYDVIAFNEMKYLKNKFDLKILVETQSSRVTESKRLENTEIVYPILHHIPLWSFLLEMMMMKDFKVGRDGRKNEIFLGVNWEMENW